MKKITCIRLIFVLCFWGSTAAFAHDHGRFGEMRACQKIETTACTAIVNDSLSAYRTCMQSFRTGAIPTGANLTAADTSIVQRCQERKANWKARHEAQ